MLIGSVVSEGMVHFVVGCKKALVDSRWAVSLLDQGCTSRMAGMALAIPVFERTKHVNFNIHVRLPTFHGISGCIKYD